ncbi:uncharacterized protein DNG_09169 [Cephalotrichum gorgonifer]|uniref:Uncharacterized protein n=1 Tax=Cephalotrichum gorgonifer TaxID=2041049 RepID=A0AAE8SZ40_9PEZI|nr:uncharacterized protein DNG_09169 [Cephalotrichum gorgonifer]
MTVVGDCEVLEGTSVAVVKVYFGEWVKRGAVEREQGMSDVGMSPMYRFYIQIRDVGDAACADRQGQEGSDDKSHEDKDEEDEEDEEESVDLIWKDWEPSVPDLREPDEPPIEGSTRPDVGWIRVAVSTVMVTMSYGVGATPGDSTSSATCYLELR